ncbi:MAG: sugar transferase [Firmicutes bacterium]|nr:sugar transferase [Bacillota bacterium]
MLNKFRSVIESGLLSFLLFWSFVQFYNLFLVREAPLTVILIIIAHYITSVFCGYWAGWRSKNDGWLYGIIGYVLFRTLALKFNVHAVLPFPLHIRLLGFIPVLTLLMFGGVIGEQRARYASINQRNQVIYPVIKRILDFVLSTFALLVLGPLMLVIAIGIKLASPGPIFFHQRRIGQHGRLINIIKFRTMNEGADKINHLQLLKAQNDNACQIKDDPRVFPFGKLLRTTSLDELPQLINVATGEMSLIGPRPLVPEELEVSDGATLKRLEVKPGLTGLAQISGRGNLTPEERLRMDIDYVEKQSFFLDLKIMLITAWRVLTRHGAY